MKKKFLWAMVAYAVLAVLALGTLSDEPIRIWELEVKLRTGTLLILALFALRTTLYFWRNHNEDQTSEPLERRS